MRRREGGQTLTEYALLLALISIVAVVVLSAVGTDLRETFSHVATALGGSPAVTSQEEAGDEAGKGPGAGSNGGGNGAGNHGAGNGNGGGDGSNAGGNGNGHHGEGNNGEGAGNGGVPTAQPWRQTEP
jgi:Flp pilus assembly pilin Flp